MYLKKSLLVFLILFMNFINSQDNGFSSDNFPDKLREEMEKLDPGEWTLFITKTPDRHWTFRFGRAELKPGDKVFVWSFFTNDGVDHLYKSEECTVTGILDKGFTRTSNEPHNPQKPTPTPKVTGPPGPCLTSETRVKGFKGSFCKKALIFSENFQSDSLENLSSWVAEIRFPKDPDYPFNVYTNNGTMALKDGKLVISPLPLENTQGTLDLSKQCSGQSNTDECIKVASESDILPPIATGKISTRKKFNFKFGKVVVRAKMPAGSWLIPEITLEPHESVSRNHRYVSGLIRVAFVRGNEELSNKLYGGAVLYDKEPRRSWLMRDRAAKGNESWTNEFHNYTVIWSPHNLTLLVDNVGYGVVDPGKGFYYALDKMNHTKQWMSGTKMAPLDELFYLSLGLRVGGLNDFANVTNKPWNNTDQNATLKFWQAKEKWLKTWHDPNFTIESVKVFAL